MNPKQSVRSRVFIGLPVYNGEKFIEETIIGIINQTFSDFTLFISDNASSDQTSNICKKYSDMDDRIIYFRQKTNIGPISNFNFVKNKNSSEYFMWAAADDVRNSNFVEILVGALDKNPLAACAMTDMIARNGDEDKIVEINSIRSDQVHRKTEWTQSVFFSVPPKNVCYCIYGLFRTEFINDLNFNEKIKYITGSEMPFLAEVSLKGRFISLPYLYFEKRQYVGSLHESEIRTKGSFWIAKQRILLMNDLIRIAISGKIPIAKKLLLISTLTKSALFGSWRTVVRVIRGKL
jgi:glycosyltransferase involved in cell wall biosynthesis